VHGHGLIEHFRPRIAELIKGRPGLVMLEVGSERGSGSTQLLAEMARSLGLRFITIDADAEVAAEAAAIVTSINPSFEAHHALAEEFLASYEATDIAVLYMDAFDIVGDWPHKASTIESYSRRNVELCNENAWKMHYAASRAAFKKVIRGGFVCFDDVWKDEGGTWQGKGKTALPFLLQSGYQEAFYVQGHCVMLQRGAEGPAKILFAPSNDAHAHLMFSIHSKLDGAGFLVFENQAEHAASTLEALGASALVYRPGDLAKLKPRTLVLANDWGAQERQIVAEARELGISTVCIQEGCLDFADEAIPRMRQADYVFLQGPAMLRHLERPNAIVTGNPKFDSLRAYPFDRELPIMINCNFTYGVYENVRAEWMRESVEACRAAGRPFFVSQHPRDRGELPPEYPVRRSDPSALLTQLKECSVVITRFSTVIYEALLLGRKVIYFNPHGEPFPIFLEDDTGAIPIARTREELVALLRAALIGEIDDGFQRRQFLLDHCAMLDGNAAENCAMELELISRGDTDHPISFCVLGQGRTPAELRAVIESIRAQRIPEYEIIVSGLGAEEPDLVRLSVEPDGVRSIGRLRERAVRQARYENFAIVGNDTLLGRGWYRGLKQYGGAFDILTSQLRLPDGSFDCDPSLERGASLFKRHVAEAIVWDEADGDAEQQELDLIERCRRRGFRVVHHPGCVAFRMDECLTQIGRVNHRRSVVASQRWVVHELPGRPETDIMARATAHMKADRVAEAADCIRFGLELFPRSEELRTVWRRLQDVFGGALSEDRWFSFGDPEYRATTHSIAR